MRLLHLSSPTGVSGHGGQDGSVGSTAGGVQAEMRMALMPLPQDQLSLSSPTAERSGIIPIQHDTRVALALGAAAALLGSTIGSESWPDLGHPEINHR